MFTYRKKLLIVLMYSLISNAYAEKWISVDDGFFMMLTHKKGMVTLVQ